MHGSRLRDEVFRLFGSDISRLGFLFFSGSCYMSFCLLIMSCGRGIFAWSLVIFVVELPRPLDTYLLIANGFARFGFILSESWV